MRIGLHLIFVLMLGLGIGHYLLPRNEAGHWISISLASAGCLGMVLTEVVIKALGSKS
jgi:hypothetical protein